MTPDTAGTGQEVVPVPVHHVHTARLRSAGDGPHLIAPPHTQFRGRDHRWREGAQSFLLDGRHVIAVHELPCLYSRTADVQEDAAREIAPWVPVIRHLAAARRLDERRWRLVWLVEEEERYNTQEERDEWKEQIRSFATEPDLARPSDWPDWKRMEGEELADVITDRLSREARQARENAAARLPQVDRDIPPLPGEWRTPGPSGLSDDWVHQVLPFLVSAWQGDPEGGGRDQLIYWAHRSDVSVAELHRASGISRATINRILAE